MKVAVNVLFEIPIFELGENIVWNLYQNQNELEPAIYYPDGFRYYEEAITSVEEQELLDFIHALEFLPYVMRGQASRRGIVRFGHDYGPVGGDIIRCVR